MNTLWKVIVHGVLTVVRVTEGTRALSSALFPRQGDVQGSRNTTDFDRAAPRFWSFLQAITSSVQRKLILKSGPGTSAEAQSMAGSSQHFDSQARGEANVNGLRVGVPAKGASPPAYLGEYFAHRFLLFSLLLVSVKTVLFLITRSEASGLQLPRQQNILCSCHTSHN